ncbi:MAG TPA: hypothetical protein VD999_05465 [Vitreimonas sp.]|nr:hypothetical protein [Vitreimonas sp.]
MTNSSIHFKVEQLRQKSLLKTVESVAVFFFSIFVTAFLPNLLIRYVYANQQLFEQPKLLEYIPTVSFVLAVAYFLFAMIGNLLREMKAQKLEKEAESMVGCDCEDCDCGSHDSHMTMMPESASVNELSAALKKSSRGRKTSKK